MILRAQGVGKVFVSEPTVKRRKHAVEICHAVIDPVKEDVGERCRSLTDGAGVSVVFDCAGVQVGLEAGMDALRFGGVYVNVAGWETPVCQVFDGRTPCS
jgi:(R,R)-butanediol dehydrogenase/meso-butanediol dehydrogenase/diacetyl reductase